MNTSLTIGEVAAASGLSPDTIRFYEREGVLPRDPRGTNSYRGYLPRACGDPRPYGREQFLDGRTVRRLRTPGDQANTAPAVDNEVAAELSRVGARRTYSLAA